MMENSCVLNAFPLSISQKLIVLRLCIFIPGPIVLSVGHCRSRGSEWLPRYYLGVITGNITKFQHNFVMSVHDIIIPRPLSSVLRALCSLHLDTADPVLVYPGLRPSCSSRTTAASLYLLGIIDAQCEGCEVLIQFAFIINKVIRT